MNNESPKWKPKEIKRVIHYEINTPGFVLVTREVPQEVLKKWFKTIKETFNDILKLIHFPNQRKAAQIIILKPENNRVDVSSYKPHRLLSMLSMSFENLLLNLEERKSHSQSLILNWFG